MKLTHRLAIPYDPALYAQLKMYQQEAARVWNDTLAEAVLYFRTMKRWISKTDLQSNRKQAYRLHSQTVQAIVDKYDKVRLGTAVKRRNGDKKAKYPWRRKQFFCIPFKQSGFEVQGESIILRFKEDKPTLAKMSSARPKQIEAWISKNLVREDVQLPIPNLATEDLSICTYGEIVWHQGKYWFHYVVDVPESQSQDTHLPFKPAGLDLGEIHSVTAATEDQALVISGRGIRSVKQGRAKYLGELNSLISRCKKGSRQWKKYIRAKKRLMEKSDAQVTDWLHQTTRQVVDFLVDQQVTHAVIGKVKGISRSTKKNPKKKVKNTRVRRQQLSLWEHARLTAYLQYKLLLEGIHVDQVNEAYTSQDCPFCHGRHQAQGRNFICPTKNRERHRDVNGAQNIARKKYHVPLKDVHVAYRQPVWLKKYRRLNGVVGTDLALAG